MLFGPRRLVRVETILDNYEKKKSLPEKYTHEQAAEQVVLLRVAHARIPMAVQQEQRHRISQAGPGRKHPVERPQENVVDEIHRLEQRDILRPHQNLNGNRMTTIWTIVVEKGVVEMNGARIVGFGAPRCPFRGLRRERLKELNKPLTHYDQNQRFQDAVAVVEGPPRFAR